MSQSAKRTDPDLWERVKDAITAGDKGGDPGEWSARKAQMSVAEYKRRGGGYDESGPSQDETSLHEWTEEDWGTRSGEESGDTGERYLPKRVRMLLTDDEYRRTTGKKRRDDRDGEQYSDQPDDVRDKIATIKDHGPTKAMLDERARDLAIDGCSDMDKDELMEAIEAAVDERDGDGDDALAAKTKDELYEMAQERGIEGRSTMNKAALVKALGKELGG